MKRKLTFLSLSIFVFFTLTTILTAQEFNGEWKCLYATTDDSDNGTGYNTIASAITAEDNFVSVVIRSSNSTYYLVGYRGADSTNGRLGVYPYGGGAADQQRRSSLRPAC